MDARNGAQPEIALFVDSSAFYAAADDTERDSARTREILSAEALITTDHVLVETWLLIAHRGGRHAADLFWNGLRAGGAAIEPVRPVDLEAAWRIGEAFADQDFSIVDRTSFAVMERLGLTRVASLDDDFAVYRFGPRRDRAFEVVR